MNTTPGRNRRCPAALITMLLTFPLSLFAQKAWKGANGDGGGGAWSAIGNWDGGTPAASDRAQFYRDGTLSSSSSLVTVTSGTASSFAVGYGKAVTLALQSAGKLEAKGAISLVGQNLGTGTGAASLTIQGPASGTATANLASFYIGYEGNNGNSLTFSGPVTVTDAGTAFSSVGQGSGAGGSSINNTLTISNGASVTRYALWVGKAATSLSGNGVVLKGAGSKLTINGGGSTSTQFLVGSIAGGSNNYLSIQDGAVATITTGLNGSTVNALRIGDGSSARSNYVTVEGTGSTLSLASSTALILGNATGFGGNSLQIGDQGTVTTTGTTTINSFTANGGNNDGRNRLTIQNGGVFTSSSAIHNSGLLQLEAGGVLNGANVLTITSTGRFEAAGSGLGPNVSTTVNSQGVLAIGLAGHSGADLLTLDSTVTLQAGSVFEATIFGSHSIDQAALGAGGTLDLSSGAASFKLVLAGYAPVEGDEWTVFTGSTSTGILGSFPEASAQLPPLAGGLGWDYSHFNETGEWKISVVPEPGSFVLMAIGFGALLVWRRRSAAAQRRQTT